MAKTQPRGCPGGKHCCAHSSWRGSLRAELPFSSHLSRLPCPTEPQATVVRSSCSSTAERFSHRDKFHLQSSPKPRCRKPLCCSGAGATSHFRDGTVGIQQILGSKKLTSAALTSRRLRKHISHPTQENITCLGLTAWGKVVCQTLPRVTHKANSPAPSPGRWRRPEGPPLTNKRLIVHHQNGRLLII